MKKLFLSVFGLMCVMLCTNAMAQTTYNLEDLNVTHRNDVLYATTKEGTPVTGIVHVYYESGTLHIEITFKDGKPNGIVKIYYESGALDSEATYKDGKRNGIEKWYYESGALRKETTFIDDKENGIWKEYSESGALEVEANFKDGKENGIRKGYGYYESGALQTEITFKDGKENGIWKQYYESGAIKGEATYIDGKENGIRKLYYESGELQLEVNYKDGKKNGIEKWYYESGALKKEITFIDDRENGIRKEYSESGELKSEANYESGELKSESQWKNGEEVGEEKVYEENGKTLENDAYKETAICIGAALQSVTCAADGGFAMRTAQEFTETLTNCFYEEYPNVSVEDFLEYADEGKNMVLMATSHCSSIPMAGRVYNQYCHNVGDLDRCVATSSFGPYTGASTVKDAVYTLIRRWRYSY